MPVRQKYICTYDKKKNMSVEHATDSSKPQKSSKMLRQYDYCQGYQFLPDLKSEFVLCEAPPIANV